MNSSTRNRVDYHSYLKSFEWVFKKNQWLSSKRPQMCWACELPMSPISTKGFDFHHRTYANLGNENLDDIVLLCRPHHRELSEIYKTNAKAEGVSLESWTYIYISVIRGSLGLKPIKESKIAKYMGEFNE